MAASVLLAVGDTDHILRGLRAGRSDCFEEHEAIITRESVALNKRWMTRAGCESTLDGARQLPRRVRAWILVCSALLDGCTQVDVMVDSSGRYRRYSVR